MKDAYTLLNLNKDIFKDFSLQASKVRNRHTQFVIGRNVRQLMTIEERMFTEGGINVSKVSIDEILSKVVSASKYKGKKQIDWTMRELRIVSYYIMKLQNDNKVYNYALDILDKEWRNMFFNGLVFYLLNSWNMIKPELRKNTCQLIKNKLQQYKDNNRRYLLFKNHADFFDESGPARMAALLIFKKIDLKEAPKILGNKPSTFSQYFYSDVIVKYYENKPVDLEVLEEVFEAHDFTRTKKLVFANLVEYADNNADAALQTQISKFINRSLGDITLTSTWAPFPGATLEEAQKLKHAMQLANLWFTRKIIETFFEVCVQDKERKDFWLKYVDYVSGFKIIGSKMTKNTLMCDPRLGSIFIRHFIETNSSNSQTSALVLCIKNKVIIEFSDTGALYVYNQGHNKTMFLRNGTRYISSINNLKIPSMQDLVVNAEWNAWSYFQSEKCYNDEGRMRHIGYWTVRLSGWLKNKVLSSSNNSSSYFDTKDDQIFTATPLPKEEEIEITSSVKKSLIDDAPKSSIEKKQNVTAAPEVKKSQSVTTSSQNFSKSSVGESNINITVSSKWFFNDKYRIICNRNGFYLNIKKGQRFVLLRTLVGNLKASGSIWIKRPDTSGWVPIVNFISGLEITIGFIKELGSCILFKQDLKQSECMRIKLD